MANQRAVNEESKGITKPTTAAKSRTSNANSYRRNQSYLFTLQRSIGNRAVQRVVEREGGSVQRTWNPSSYRDRLKNFADIVANEDNVYDWFSVEARRYAEGGSGFHDITPEPNARGRSGGGSDVVPMEE